MRVETVVFQGIRYRRYPDAKQSSTRNYFSPGVADRRAGRGSLHQEIWKAAHGPIPEGCEIHHRDHQPSNNALDNLECLTAAEHRRHHRESADTRAKLRTPQQVEHLATIRPLATEWHRSEEGRAWHREHGRTVAANQPLRAAQCEQCGDAFVSLHPKRFCSNACRAAARRATGADDEQRACARCGATFTTNRYSRVTYCSRSCASKARAT